MDVYVLSFLPLRMFEPGQAGYELIRHVFAEVPSDPKSARKPYVTAMRADKRGLNETDITHVVITVSSTDEVRVGSLIDKLDAEAESEPISFTFGGVTRDARFTSTAEKARTLRISNAMFTSLFCT